MKEVSTPFLFLTYFIADRRDADESTSDRGDQQWQILHSLPEQSESAS